MAGIDLAFVINVAEYRCKTGFTSIDQTIMNGNSADRGECKVNRCPENMQGVKTPILKKGL
jgi:hypothetical protein